MVRTRLTMNSEGQFRFNSGETLYYLKKKVMLARQGIFIQPNPSYIKKMVELLELEGKKAKSLPHHSSLSTAKMTSKTMNGLTPKDSRFSAQVSD